MSRHHTAGAHPSAEDHVSIHDVAGAQPARHSQPPGRLRAIWDSLSAGVGVALGVLPHVLHHIGLIAGAALVTGAGGNALFFVLGLLFSVPLLRRLYRRFHTWRAPAIAAVVFAAMFALSAFVIGPALAGNPPSGSDPSSPTQTPPVDHSQHHGG